jgi:hypothetical protein
MIKRSKEKLQLMNTSNLEDPLLNKIIDQIYIP